MSGRGSERETNRNPGQMSSSGEVELAAKLIIIPEYNLQQLNIIQKYITRDDHEKIDWPGIVRLLFHADSYHYKWSYREALSFYKLIIDGFILASSDKEKFKRRAATDLDRDSLLNLD